MGRVTITNGRTVQLGLSVSCHAYTPLVVHLSERSCSDDGEEGKESIQAVKVRMWLLNNTIV